MTVSSSERKWLYKCIMLGDREALGFLAWRITEYSDHPINVDAVAHWIEKVKKTLDPDENVQTLAGQYDQWVESNQEAK